MNDISKATTAAPAVLADLAAQAQYYRDNMWKSGLELGRVLTEAKALVPHGEWAKWLEKNVDTSVRGAQTMMQLWTKFGSKPNFKAIDKSKLIKMLALPEGSEEEFIEQHDIGSMSAREVGEAVKEARRQETEIPEEIAEKLSQQGKEIERLQGYAQEAIDAANTLRMENRNLHDTIRDNEAVLQDMQTQYDEAQRQLTLSRCREARGDAERAPRDELTEEIFSGAVRQFMGICSTMPQMGKRFAAMDEGQRMGFEEGLLTMENWAKGARRAMDMVCGEVLEV